MSTVVTQNKTMSEGSAKPRFRLAIVGGGIAGLTLAVTLGHFASQNSAAEPLEVHIYESGPELTTVGAGISVWPRTWAVMRALGVYEDLARASVQPLDGNEGNKSKPAFVFRKSDQSGEGYEFARVMAPNGSTTMHRADMVEVLIRHLPPKSCFVHTSKRFLTYTHAGPSALKGHPPAYILHFADGTTAEADVLVGADGIKSRVRTALYEYAHARDCEPRQSVDKAKARWETCARCARAVPKWTGTVAYRYLIPTERMAEVNPEHTALKVECPMSYCGKEKHIITYPISHGKYLNWIGFVTILGGEGTSYPHRWVMEAAQEEVMAHFAGWEPEVEQMINLVESPMLWAIHAVESLPFAVDGGVGLVGDAVHAMTTHLGAGGGQAIEDAYILGRLLADGRTTLGLVPEVLRVYEGVRLPFARAVVSNARKTGLMYEFSWPGMYDGIPRRAGEREDSEAELEELGGAIRELWQWQWEGKVEEQWEQVQRNYAFLVRDSAWARCVIV
ncbi:hypothetical protein BC628DRAFT_1422680 [Trametes gibbosa]|nr:hypothetical protein BC628DRAFT_1422680 [Trametes gibbosa]